MEETVDPILAKLNGKKSTPPPAAEEDPILARLNASKKKEPTTVEESSGVGGKAQPATVSSLPSGKESAQPGKSSPVPGKPNENWFTELGETLAAPVESAVRGTVAAATDMLPGMVAAGEAGMAKNDYENTIINQAYPTVSTPQGPVRQNITEEMRQAALNNYLNKVGPEQFKIEKDAYELNQLRRRADLLKYSDQQDEERRETLGDTPQTTGEIKDIKTALQWLGGAAGNALGTAPAMIAGPVFPFLMEKGEAYKESLGKIQEQTGLSRDEILALDLDKAARENSDISGTINTGLEIAGNLAVFGRFIPKKLATKFITKVASSKLGAPAVAAMGEGVTEYIQALDTKLAAYMSTGKYADVFEAANAFTSEDWEQINQSAYSGLAGGGLISGAGSIKAPSPKQVITEERAVVQDSGDVQGAQQAAEKILENTSEPVSEVAPPAEPVTTPEVVQQEQEITQSTPVSEPISQPEVDPITTVGDNYVKRDNRWFVKDAEGIERPLISDNPNKTIEEQNTELAQLKELKAQLEQETPLELDLSPTGKRKIADMDAFTAQGRVRKWLWEGGQLLWNSITQGEGKPRITGLKDETGYGTKERADIKPYVNDTKGISVEKAAELLADKYQDRSPQDYRNAIIEVFSTNPKTWYERQVRDEDPDYAIQEEQRFEEAGQLNEQIKQLETQEEGIKATNQQLYENERRVTYSGSQSEEPAGAGAIPSPGTGSQAQVDPRASIRKNGDEGKSKQALAELQTKTLTHVPGLGMGQNQAKGTYVSTEDQNRYETEDRKPVKVKVNVQKPFVSEGNTFYDIQREIIQSRFGKNAIEDLTETEADLLAEMVTEHFMTEGFDSIYLPQSETQEGELIVFDRGKVSFEGGKRPPATPDEIETQSNEPRSRNYAIADRILKSDANEAIKRGIQERGASYIPKGLEITLTEAKNLIEFYGDRADSVVRDLTNGLTWDTRTALTAKLYEKYVEQGNNEAAVDIAMWQAKQSLEAGRASNAAKVWKMITESGEENIVLSIERERQAQLDLLVQPVAQELQQTREQIEAEIRKQVEERVQKEVGDRLKKAKLITKEKRKEIADFFDSLKVDTKNKGMLSASVIPGVTLLPHVWNASIDIMKQAVLTGADVANAIQAGIDYIKANQKEAIDEEKFKEFMAPKLEAIVPKEPIKREGIDDEKIKTPKTLKGRKKKEFIDEVIQAYNDGKLTDKKFEEIYAGKMGFKEFTEADRKRIRELAKTISEAEKFENVLREDFTNENIKKYKELIKQAKQANNLLQEFAQAPASIEDTLISIMQGNLLSPLSQVANIYYNVNYQPLRFLSMLGGSFVDYSLSKLAKIGLASKALEFIGLDSKALEVRTIDPVALQRGYFKGGWNGLIEGAQQVVTGVDQDPRSLREIQTNFSPKRAIQRWADKNRTAAQKANDYVEGTLGIPAEVMFRLLNLGDKPFRRAAEMAKAMEMASLRGLKGNDLLKFLVVPDPESAQQIKQAGDEATFQQSEGAGKWVQQKITEGLNKIANIPYVGKPAKVLLKSQIPFVKTPWNVAAETMQYAAPPITLAMGINQIAKGNKRDGSILIGKAMVGAMIQAVAYQLFIKGLLTGDDDKEKKKREFQYDNVSPSNSLNTSAIARGLAGQGWETQDGDIWSPYIKMGVTGILFDHYSNTYKERVANNEPLMDTDAYLADMITSGPKVASASLDQTFLQGTSKLLEAIKDGGNKKTTDWLITTTEAVGSIVYPNTLATISKASDEFLRDTQSDDFWEKLGNVYKAKMFMGEDLPAKVSIWGDKVTGNPKGRNKYMFYLFDPTKFREVDTDDFRYKLYQSFKKDYDADWLPGAPSRTITVNKEKIKLPSDQYELLSIYVGKERADMTQAYINSTEWDRNTDEQKKDELKAIYRDAAEIGRDRFMIDMGYNVGRILPIELEIMRRRVQRQQNRMRNAFEISN